MPSKHLRRLDISQMLRDRLGRHGLTNCADVLSKSQLELMKLSGCCGITVQDLHHKCCVMQAVTSVTALDLLRSRGLKRHFLATSLPDLDNVLHGGIPTATITEIAGPAGCGKTQFCITLAVLTTLPVEAGGLGGGVLYIDTEGAFSAKRLLEISYCRLPWHFPDDAALKELASKIHIISVQSSKNLMNRLHGLEEDIIVKNVKLIILDSVASLVRKEYSNLEDGMIHRTNFLVAEAALLKYIAENFNIPVIVTNQITTHYGDHPPVTSPLVPGCASGGVDAVMTSEVADEEGSYLTAALGNTWSHSVNTRLILQFLPGDRRQILVAKSPVAPFTCFDFIIGDKGVVQDVQGQGHYLGTDPGKQAIQGRAALSVGATQW